MSALPMAISTVASSQLHTKLSSLSLPQSPLPLPTYFLSFKPLKPFKLNIQTPNSVCLLSRPHFQRAFAALDSFEVAEDDHVTAQDDPQTETEEYEQQQDREEEPTPTGLNEEGRLYVGNLPYSITSSQLAEVFEEAGRVVGAEIIYDRVTDRSRGFGFVTMGSLEEANEAIRMFNGSQIGGRTARVNFPEVPKGGEKEVMAPRIRNDYKNYKNSPYKIYAGNLGWGLTSQGLKDAFDDQPGVLSAIVIYEKDTGRSRGFGFVTFESAESAETALNNMNGVVVEGRPLRLNLAENRARPPPAPEGNTEYNLENSEVLSSIGG